MPAPRNWLLGLAVAIASAGCASTNAPEEESARLLREREARIADLEREVAAREARIETLSEQVESGLPAVSAAPSGMGTTRYNQIPGGDLLPPASPGECYARVFVPLCGKTRDIGWLLARGYRVAGAELSRLAVDQLFGDLGIEPEVAGQGRLTRCSAGGNNAACDSSSA